MPYTYTSTTGDKTYLRYFKYGHKLSKASIPTY